MSDADENARHGQARPTPDSDGWKERKRRSPAQLPNLLEILFQQISLLARYSWM